MRERGTSSIKYKPKTLSPVQVAQVVKALLLLGVEHITKEDDLNGSKSG